MNCRDLTGFLADYFAGELPEQVSGEFEMHLSNCGSCHIYLAQYRQTIVLGKAASTEAAGEAPEQLVQAIMAALKAAE
jgi:anti-sigma factor RsiW